MLMDHRKPTLEDHAQTHSQGRKCPRISKHFLQSRENVVFGGKKTVVPVLFHRWCFGQFHAK